MEETIPHQHIEPIGIATGRGCSDAVRSWARGAAEPADVLIATGNVVEDVDDFRAPPSPRNAD